ncbi:hypothetical protein GN956_G23219 [Arapaima gigas]
MGLSALQLVRELLLAGVPVTTKGVPSLTNERRVPPEKEGSGTQTARQSPAETQSWSQGGTMDPEDVKSLDSNEGGVLAEERSENNSSNSDIVHVEREEAELLEAEAGPGSKVAEAGTPKPELQESVLSVLDTDPELAELGADVSQPDQGAADPETPKVIEAPETLKPTEAEGTELSPPSDGAEDVGLGETEPPPTVVPAEPESLPIAQDLLPPQEPELEPEVLPVQPQQDPEVILEHTPPAAAEAPTQEISVAPMKEETPVPRETPPKSELPILLYGGAALVAVAAVLVYGAMVYRKK